MHPIPTTLRQRLGHWLRGDRVDYGCGYCADHQNRHYGHVSQVASDERSGRILIRCPRCRSLYSNTAGGFDETRRLTPAEAAAEFPSWTPDA